VSEERPSSTDSRGYSYESERLVAEYLHFHYAAPGEILPWGGPLEGVLEYAVRVVDRFGNEPAERALEIGCAVGRSAFELSRQCKEVVALDYAQAFIDAAEILRTEGRLPYRFALEGNRSEDFVAHRPAGVHPDRIAFRQGDAHELPDDLGTFDRVLGANLLCRLHHPRQFLKRLATLVRPGGLLLLNSPFTWMEEHADPSEWIGGQPGGPSSAEALEDLLDDDFEKIDECTMPFLLRETARKYQLTFAHSGLWQKR